MTLGSRIAVMKDGVLQQIGTPDDIYRRPANTYVAGFIGSPTMNFIAGHVEDTPAGGQFSSICGSLQLACPATREATLGVRPEHIELRSDARWRAEVTLVEPTGADTYVVLKTALGPVTVRVAPQTPVRVGELTGLAVNEAHANWFDAQSGLRVASAGAD
jgi:multiple sugar transport system ATP-binding protein